MVNFLVRFSVIAWLNLSFNQKPPGRRADVLRHSAPLADDYAAGFLAPNAQPFARREVRAFENIVQRLSKVRLVGLPVDLPQGVVAEVPTDRT